MKINNIVYARNVFQKIKDEKIPVKLAWKVVKFLNKTDESVKFYGEKFKGIVDEFSQKDENGSPITNGNGFTIIKGKESDCSKAIKELNELEVDKPEIIFTLDELDCLQMSISDMDAISEFIEE